MDDDSDDGNLPGQSFFQKNINENEDHEINEGFENDFTENKFDNQYYDSNQNYENEYNDGYYYDNYEDNNFEKNGDNYYYKEEDNKNYNNDLYEIDNKANNNNSHDYNDYSYNNSNYNKNSNNNYNNTYRKQYNNHHFYSKYNSIKPKESYITSFLTNFKLWVTLIIKTISSQNKKIIFSENNQINKEINDSFLKSYDFDSNKIKEKNNLKINLQDFSMKHTVGKNYNVEFLIIIKDKIKVFFVKKHIEIKVEGEIYFDKFPKFYFAVNKYKLTLNYKNKLKSNDEENNNKKILEINKPDQNNKFFIGMCPKYTINDQEFGKNYLEINKEQNIKDPQKEMRECLNNLIMKYEF